MNTDVCQINILILFFLPQIDSDLASSQASSRGSSPFLPPAMPLLKMKTVPVSESYNESLVDTTPDRMSTDSESESNGNLMLTNLDIKQLSSYCFHTVQSIFKVQIMFFVLLIKLY